MTRYYDELATYERDGFEIIVDKTWEDIDPWDQLSECFDSKEQLYADIDSGKYDWFMLRVRAFVDSVELGSAYLGGCLYEDAEEVLKDGTAEDLIDEAIRGAKLAVYPLMRKLQAINEELEREFV
jgi:hypothetical protein